MGEVVRLYPEETSRPRVVFRDPTLSHQVIIHTDWRSSGLYVGCNCDRLHTPILTAEYALAVYRQHLTEEGVT